MMDRTRSKLTMRVVQQSRVVVDNDFAGDPDGLVALAHHLLSPTNRVDAVTTTFLAPALLPPDVSPDRTAAAGARVASALIAALDPARRPLVCVGAEQPFTKDGALTSASQAIIDVARSQDDLPLLVACGGPLTNIATALTHAPDIATRFELIWIGGSLAGADFEYNRDTDLAAAEAVMRWPGLVIHHVPLETYRRCAYSVVELEEDLGMTGKLGRWLCDQFQNPPEWVQLGGVWPLGDSPPVLISALGTESSRFETIAERNALTHTYIDIDFRLIVGDMLAKLRRHERERTRI